MTKEYRPNGCKLESRHGLIFFVCAAEARPASMVCKHESRFGNKCEFQVLHPLESQLPIICISDHARAELFQPVLVLMRAAVEKLAGWLYLNSEEIKKAAAILAPDKEQDK